MEIEAKYAASEQQFESILNIGEMGEYRLNELADQILTDRYMDTSKSDVQKGGYACRIREKKGQLILTVKGMGSAEGSIHRREEHEAEIPQEMPLDQWPESPARNLVLSLTRSKPLMEICTIHQRRAKRMVCQKQRRVGEMSLDVVDIQVGDQLKRYYEIEVELQGDGTIQDLKALDKILKDHGLRPEPHSKFERALILIEESSGDDSV